MSPVSYYFCQHIIRHQFRVSFIVFQIAILLILAAFSPVKAASPVSENEKPNYFDELQEELKEGKVDKLDTHYYWDQGLHVVSRKNNFRLKIGGHMGIDMGYIHAGGDLEDAFSSLDGFEPDFRRLHVSTLLTIYDALEFKFEIDFANVRSVKDIWLRYKKSPFLRHFKFGHVKEPFSLEKLASLKNMTFMERALPVYALAPGRNIGIMFSNAELEERITYAAGFFWNTHSINETSDPQDSISEANGSDITIRITGLPRYEDEGRDLLHLGVCYTRGPRQSGENDALRVSSLPESYIADRTLVDTDEFNADKLTRINIELATVLGPVSFQSEFIYYSADSDTAKDPDFWGYYLYGSFFFTREHREYDKSNGVFSMVHPNRNFSFRDKRWGAWELALRHSFLDLNDGDINGGKERNFTLAINWYLKSNMRVMFNYVRADVEDRDNSRVIDDGSANIFQTRFQIRY